MADIEALFERYKIDHIERRTALGFLLNQQFGLLTKLSDGSISDPLPALARIGLSSARIAGESQQVLPCVCMF
jgi:hypothetical protein